MAQNVNYAGYTRPTRIPAGAGATDARRRRAAAAARQPQAASRFALWTGLDIYSPNDFFTAINVFTPGDYTTSVATLLVSPLTEAPSFSMKKLGVAYNFFSADLANVRINTLLAFNTESVDPSLKNNDARFDGQFRTHVMFVDASASAVGICTDTPSASYALTVNKGGSGGTLESILALGRINATHFVSTVAIGTAPYQCTSTTLCTNLNADLLDGQHAAAFALAASIPAGLDTQIQFNDGGVLGADADLAWNKTTKQLTISAAGDAIVKSAGDVKIDGTSVTIEQGVRLYFDGT